MLYLVNMSYDIMSSRDEFTPTLSIEHNLDVAGSFQPRRNYCANTINTDMSTAVYCQTPTHTCCCFDRDNGLLR